MDPITVLMRALSLAVPALKPVADQATKVGYTGIKRSLIHKFGAQQPAMPQALVRRETNPEIFEPAADSELARTGVPL